MLSERLICRKQSREHIFCARLPCEAPQTRKTNFCPAEIASTGGRGRRKSSFEVIQKYSGYSGRANAFFDVRISCTLRHLRAKPKQYLLAYCSRRRIVSSDSRRSVFISAPNKTCINELRIVLRHVKHSFLFTL